MTVYFPNFFCTNCKSVQLAIKIERNGKSCACNKCGNEFNNYMLIDGSIEEISYDKLLEIVKKKLQ